MGKQADKHILLICLIDKASASSNPGHKHGGLVWYHYTMCVPLTQTLNQYFNASRMFVACWHSAYFFVTLKRLFFLFWATGNAALRLPRQCDRVVKVMDSKSIGLCPQGFKSPRCRIYITCTCRIRSTVFFCMYSTGMYIRITLETGLEPAISSLGGRRLIH